MFSKTPTHPQIIISFFVVPTPALVDIGSQITAISESFYEYFLQDGKITALPVSIMVLSTAIGKEPAIMMEQILSEISLVI